MTLATLVTSDGSNVGESKVRRFERSKNRERDVPWAAPDA